MKRFTLAIAAAAATLGIASPANAAQTIVVSGPSGTFGNDEVVCGISDCTFEETYNFFTPEGYELVSATISSVSQSAFTNIDLDWVTLNGVTFDLLLSHSQVEFGTLLNEAIIAGGNNTIVVHGTTGGDGAYSGVLAFAPGNAVPEPATWAMMLMGFGSIGFAMRRRRQPSFAQIA